MSVTCTRHPAHTAWWQCPRCFKPLCPLCVSRRSSKLSNQSKTLYYCPICGVEARNLELNQVIPPLWKRLPKFIAYPISSGFSAGLILALALLATMLSQPRFFPAAVFFAAWSVTVTYAFAALKSTSTGNLRPPIPSKQIWGDHLPTVFGQLLLYFAFYWIILLLIDTTHWWVVVPAMAACAMVLPAVLILITVKRDLSQALNPYPIIELIGRIGRSYLQLLGFLLLTMVMLTFLSDAAANHLPGWARIFAMAAACNYVTVILYHMTGYVILQYHRRLDYPVNLDNVLASLEPTSPTTRQKADTQPQASPGDDLLATIDRLERKGEFKRAVRQIEMRAKSSQINDLDLSQRYLDLLRKGNYHGRFLAHAARHLELLSKSGYNYKALSLYLECIRLDKKFAPQAPVLFKIACWLDEAGKSREAVYVLNSLIKHHPQNNLVPKALYRVAQIFHKGMKDAERSKKVLAGLIQKFPDHEITPFARNYFNGL